jgi:uncharacterized protein
MLRFVITFFLGILLISVVRSVLGALFKTLSSTFGTKEPERQAPTPGSLPTSGELKRDPVCGTYTVASASVQQTVNGEKHYFCSAKCRDEFLTPRR